MPEATSTEVIIPDLPEVNITTLFDRDPLSLNDADLDAIVGWFREQRVSYRQGVKDAGNKKRAGKPKASAASAEDQAAAADLLGDLGL